MSASSSSTVGYLTHMVVTHLNPMFRATTGDYDQANIAALETVRAWLTGNPADLFLIGQMIALGLGALSSVSLSMAEDLPINLILRLRGNAVSLSRASRHCRSALPVAEPAVSRPDAPFADRELVEQERVIAEVDAQRRGEPAPAATQQVTSRASDDDFPPRFPESFDTMKPAMARVMTESERRAGKPEAPLDSDRILRAAWSETFPDHPPEAIEELLRQQQTVSQAGGLRSAALGTTANHLIAGSQQPQS
jgi:hypothetical protein